MTDLTSTKTKNTSDYDTIARLSWKVGSFCSIYSRSTDTWFEGQIVAIKGELSDEWLVVKYLDNNSNKTKSIQRNNKHIKPLPKDHILSLTVGSFCSIYSNISQVWCKGECVEIFADSEGEWLKIVYHQDNKIVITEIQRLSKDLKPWTHSDDEKRIIDIELVTKIARKHKSFSCATDELSSLLPFETELNYNLAKSILIHIIKQDFHNAIEYKYEEEKSDSEIDKIIALPNIAMIANNNRKRKQSGPVEYKWSEIKKHQNKNDLWLVFADKVFDITSFLKFHPGGIDVILQIAAKTQDITNVFKKLNHPPVTNKIITKHYIGNVSNKTHFQRMSLDLNAMKLAPIWNADSNNLNINIVNQNQQASLRDHYVIQWNDLFTVRIMVLDKQHESIIKVINKIYVMQEIKYLSDLLKRWDVHCKTEETLFEYYKFDEKSAVAHMKDHKELYHQIKDQITFIRIKYNDQQPKAKELSDFAAKISKRFISHHHQHDIKYVDHLDKGILNDL